MAVIYFFPFNVLFIFILTNIFLAIINQTYQEASTHARDQAIDEEKQMSMWASIFFCFNAHQHKQDKVDTGDNQIVKKNTLGLDKSEEGYLEVFDKLALNLQPPNSRDIGQADLKLWAINCADEIKTELKVRTNLRNQARDALVAKLTRA